MQNQQNTVDIKKYAVNFTRSRHALGSIVAFTLINIILAATGSGWLFLFSAMIPLEIFVFFDAIGLVGVGLVVALLGTGIYFAFWLLAKKYRVFMLVALIIFAIDTFLFLLLVLGFGDFGHIINLAFSGWILYYLIIGTIAWAKLSNVNESDIAAVQNAVANEEANAALGEIAPGGSAQTIVDDTEYDSVNANIAVTRKKSFVGSAIKFYCVVNMSKQQFEQHIAGQSKITLKLKDEYLNNSIAPLKNGQTVTMNSTRTPSSLFVVAFTSTGRVYSNFETVQLRNNETAPFSVTMKMGMSENSITLTREG